MREETSQREGEWNQQRREVTCGIRSELLHRISSKPDDVECSNKVDVDHLNKELKGNKIRLYTILQLKKMIPSATHPGDRDQYDPRPKNG